MSDYFRHARIVGRSLDWARKTAPVPVGPNLGLSRDGIRFLDPIQAARDAVVVDRRVPGGDRCRHRGDRGSAVLHPAARRSLPRRRLLSGQRRPRGAADASSSRAPALYARLSEMHDCGLLGRVFPEFQAISWRVVRDFYHKYTVDEHTLLTIRNLERLSTTTDAYRQRFRNVLLGARGTRAARARAAAARRRQVARRRPRDARACAWRGTSSTGCSWPATRARPCCS